MLATFVFGQTCIRQYTFSITSRAITHHRILHFLMFLRMVCDRVWYTTVLAFVSVCAHIDVCVRARLYALLIACMATCMRVCCECGTRKECLRVGMLFMDLKYYIHFVFISVSDMLYFFWNCLEYCTMCSQFSCNLVKNVIHNVPTHGSISNFANWHIGTKS